MKHNFTINLLPGMAVFATAADCGSFTAAAAKLGVSTSAVSQAVRRLEQHFETTLFNRTTRQLALTADGEAFLEHCQNMIIEAESAAKRLNSRSSNLFGTLRISAPHGLANALAKILSPMLIESPELKLDLELDDGLVDFTTSKCDFALRVGTMPSSNWISRKVGSFSAYLVAAVGYLDGRTLDGDDLQCAIDNLDWLLPKSRFRTAWDIELVSVDNSIVHVSIPTRSPKAISSNSAALLEMCLAGMGAAVLVGPEIGSLIDAKRLSPVFPEWFIPSLPLHAVYPNRDTLQKRSRVAIELISKYL
jgi:DNA-binding transcriptional LysR family regulator